MGVPPAGSTTTPDHAGARQELLTAPECGSILLVLHERGDLASDRTLKCRVAGQIAFLASRRPTPTSRSSSPLYGQPCLFGECDQLGVAPLVQGDQDPQHFAAHRVHLRFLGSDVPCLHQ